MIQTDLLRALGALGVLLLAGTACQLKPDRQVPGASTVRAPLDSGDPVRVSELRERAITTVQEGAKSQQPEVRSNAVEASMRAKSRLAPLIGGGLSDENAAVRSVAAMSVGRAHLTELAPAVEALLSDPSPFVRCGAILGLSKCGVAVDPTPLAGMLLADPSPRVRAQAAFVLGEIGNDSAVPLLRQAAQARMARASAQEVRIFQLQLSEALVKLGDNDALPPIRAALYPGRPDEFEVAALAVQIIGQVKDRGAIDQLIYLAATKDREGRSLPAEVRLAVASSLAKMGLTQGAFIADEFWTSPTPALRAQAALVYGEIGDLRALTMLEKLLGDPDHRVRVAAAAAVLQIVGGSSDAERRSTN